METQLLRFTTAGSVDDGKSTLIGRLLYEAKGIYEDQLQSIRKAGINRSTGPLDFSLLTDGLKAEREQGITIDVAYRYFATPRRKFIIADTPGHEQYTRNMATGASTAELAIVLVDARKGVLPQSRRHAFIASLLGIAHVVVAINKMDLVDFSREQYESITREFRAFCGRIHLANPIFIPISALDGDNVVKRSARTPWFEGQPLLELLETIPLEETRNFEDLRFPVQYVVRPTLDFRGYAGQMASGVLRKGDTVMALPSGRITRVQSLPSFDGEMEEVFPPMSVTVCLEDEIDLSRGDMLVDPASMPQVSRRIEAKLVWMHPEPLEPEKPYLLKHTTQQMAATVARLRYRIDVNTLEEGPAGTLGLNEIGAVTLETRKPLFFDSYRRNHATGSFILIDPLTNATVAAGMIEDRAEDVAKRIELPALEFDAGPLTPAERYARAGHRPATIWLTARKDVAYLMERKLFDRGCQVHVLADDHDSHLLPELARVLNAAGLIAICSIASDDPREMARAEALAGADRFVRVAPQALSPRDSEAADKIIWELEDRGVLPRSERFAEGEGI